MKNKTVQNTNKKNGKAIVLTCASNIIWWNLDYLGYSKNQSQTVLSCTIRLSKQKMKA